ncbi:PepSY domain-containing protein [Pseudoalteromonas sp. J010]|uniref:PepSY-associated TM helix domain-containing protein n=1 Tax=Pseudoalteromonas sp. J010 TaxID=998465 RepID=UPI000F653F7D|nr:PepSY-associated TM helix domain-containing protein [Pseudoalteromonas sp. J010]RRS09763.1 PepSY domain-containing protein [Pseudoalteromonas sp. J010]
MRESFFRSMTWLHTWVGLLVCWLLFLIFFAGTASFFRHEISLWAQPATHHLPQYNHAFQQQTVTKSIERFQHTAPTAESWRIEMPTERRPSLLLMYSEKPKEGERRGKRHSEYLDPITLDALPEFRDTKGGNFFYRLHFDLHYMNAITARWIVCFATLFMLIALISGVVIHKRIFKDLFQFRSKKGLRSWLDAHNVSSVIALPFHIMITYTGLVTLIFMLLPQPAQQRYEDKQTLRAERYPLLATAPATGQPLQELALNKVLDHYYTNSGNAPLRRIVISSPNDASATIKLYANAGRAVQDDPPSWMYNAASGELLKTHNVNLSGAENLYGGMIALHTGRLAEPTLRWLYFIAGLAGCVMIATGAVMWAKRLRQKLKRDEKPGFGLKLVESLNLGTIMGLPAATAAFFYANRLLPTELVARADKEVLVFFIVWAIVAIAACYKSDRLAWQLTAKVNALAWAGLPVVSMLTIEGNLVSYLIHKQWVLFGFDALAIGIAVSFLVQARKLGRSQVTPAAPSRRSQREVKI